MLKMRCLLLAAAIIILLPVVNALAWYDDTQHKLNELYGTAHPVYAMLEKYERDSNGRPTTRPVAGAEFYLYFEDKAKGDEQIGGSYLSDEYGTIYSPLLTKTGEYYFLETSPPLGYSFDGGTANPVTRYYFKFTGEEESIIKITAYNIVDISQPPHVEEPDPEEPNTEEPNTGDKTNTAVLWLLFGCSLTAAVCIFIFHRIKERKEDVINA
ncbi:MAG: prealbumin-like fold domain-containing protein [Oscillospiraceae bacterium]|jgi:hypothetical protein|nr:prealbumin-like fold domain-containing protein [Oscillospiraceae bacterium]